MTNEEVKRIAKKEVQNPGPPAALLDIVRSYI